VSSSAVSTSAINLTATNKVTATAQVSWPAFDTVNTLSLLELSNTYVGKTDAFKFGTAGTSAAITANLAGNVGSVATFYSLAAVGINDAAFHLCTPVFDKSLSSGETYYYQDGTIPTVYSRPSDSNNTNNFGNYVLYAGSRAGTSQFSRIYMKGLALFSTVLSSVKISELNTAQ
jgi:hypothetical protein